MTDWISPASTALGIVFMVARDLRKSGAKEKTLEDTVLKVDAHDHRFERNERAISAAEGDIKAINARCDAMSGMHHGRC